MSNSKKAQVREMFDNIAPTYDRLNHILSFNFDKLWRRRTVNKVAAGCPKEILDVAAGTGDVAIALARRISTAKITGIDLSDNMLSIGRDKVEEKELSDRIVLMQGDAEQMSFADGSFDAVTIGFGIRNFGDIDAGLREASRVLRPGGKIYILEFSTPKGKIFGALYKFYFHNVLPLIGKFLSKDSGAYEYLPESVDNFPEYLLFLRRIESSGFTKCRADRLMRGIAYIYEGEKL